MTVSVQPRQEAKPSLAQAVQGVKQEAPRQTNTVETPTPTAATEEKKDDFLSPKFAQLARQEKQIRAAVAKMKAEREAFDAEKKAYLNGYVPKDKLKSDPLAAFSDAGISYDEIAQRLISAPQSEVDPTIRALQAKIEQLESEQANFKKTNEESKSEAYKQALDSIRHKVKGVVEANPEFELIKALDQSEAVVSLIEETFKSEGYVMTEEEAAKEVEEYLAEEALKMASLDKIKKKLAPQEPAEKQPEPDKPQLTTLTHAVNATPTGRRLNEKERIANAKAVAQGLPKPFN